MTFSPDRAGSDGSRLCAAKKCRYCSPMEFFVTVFRQSVPRCRVVRKCGIQCRKPALSGRTRCRSHGGAAQKPQTPQGRYARELVLHGFGASEVAARSGISARHAFRLRSQNRVGQMRLEGGRPRDLPRSESRGRMNVAGFSAGSRNWVWIGPASTTRVFRAGAERRLR